MFNLFAPHATDSYKLGHRRQYEQGTSLIYANFTPRSMKHLAIPTEYTDGKLVWYGGYGAVKEIVELWQETFFEKPLGEIIYKYTKRVPAFTGEEKPFVGHLEDLHAIGYLPMVFKELPEGSSLRPNIPTMTCYNTNPKAYWVTNYLETIDSNEIWKPSTVATIAFAYRRIFENFAIETGSPLDFVAWQGHYFADRGMAGMYDMAKGGSGHSTSFYGSDSISAFDYLSWAYRGDETFLGGSVPATEHSVISLGGKDNELQTVKRIITEVHPSGIVSIVSDTWDFYHLITDIARELKDDILARTPNSLGIAKTVFRPDSGNPGDIICGDPTAEPGTPENKGALQCLAEIFGSTTNSKGYKVLNERVGLIYGDSITIERAIEILTRMKQAGWASCNIVLGIGSFTYQMMTRDTLGWAMKATYGEVNGEARDMFKDPKTSLGSKTSAKGLLRVELDSSGDYYLLDQQTWEQEAGGYLKTIYKDGTFSNQPSIADIRGRIYWQR